MIKNRFSLRGIPIFLVFLSSLLFSLCIYKKEKFGEQSIDETLFYFFNGIEGTSMAVYISAFKAIISPFILLFPILIIPILNNKSNKKSIIEIVLKKRRKIIKFSPLGGLYHFRFGYSIILLFSALLVCYEYLGVNDYATRLNDYSTIFEEHYVNSKDVSIQFPDEKRNLIILYLESMENTLINEQDGGGWRYTVIPELKNIAEQHINFSENDKIGGALPVRGTEWTVAGLVSTSSGIPLKLPIDGNSYTSSNNFLAGAYTLGDVLKKEGYNLEFMVGSEAQFGGRSNYYIKHGNYKIYDVNTAIKSGRMFEHERVWWGFDDTHLFTWAKEEISELAKKEKPFSFSFLTVNTHFPDGYLEQGAPKEFATQYENVHAYSSKQVSEFVSWLKEQEFYRNTTLVILGDHLSMQDPNFYKPHLPKDYRRTIYNVFINSAIEASNSKNREFTTFDMYPTILASIGAEIEGERLGLGTNLFSESKTLVEILSYDVFSKELAKNSKFYNLYILKDDYFNLLHDSHALTH